MPEPPSTPARGPWASRGRRWAQTRPEVRFIAFGGACCAVELIPLLLDRYRPERWNIRPACWTDDANVLVVAGAVNGRLAQVVRGLYERIPEPRWVVAAGACACGGGPYAEGPGVLDGVDTVVPVDVYLPGNPPRPEALIHALLQVQELMRRGIRGGHVDRGLHDRGVEWRLRRGAGALEGPGSR